MSSRCVYLGWDGPLLPRAVDWLWEQASGVAGDGGAASRCDLSGWLVVVPGGRARRRMVELLAERGEGQWMQPPVVITQGELANELCGLGEAGESRVASELERLLARVVSLQGADAEVLRRIAPTPPGEEDVSGWLALASDLGERSRDLWGELLSVSEAAERCSAIADFADGERWAALAALEAGYESVLGEAGLVDPGRAQREAVDAGRCTTARRVLLVGAIDLPGALRAMLKQVADRVTALVGAPEAESAGFDELGGLVTAYWCERRIELREEQVRIVDQPRDQVLAVVEAVTGGEAERGWDEITVGLGDESIAGAVERALDLVGVRARPAVGRAVTQSRPAMLLASLGAYASARRMDEFASLLRHPDMDRYLRDVAATWEADEAGNGEAGAEAVEHWLTLLDEYAARHLQGRLLDEWLGEKQALMKRLHDAVWSLLPEPARSRPDACEPLGTWSEGIAAVLRSVYGEMSLSRFEEEENQLLDALESIAGALREQWEQASEGSLGVSVSFGEAVALTLSRLSGQSVPRLAGPAAVELVGWLELALDDAPQVIVTGVNEGQIPSSRNADALLPDSLRRSLGLADNRSRYARDALLMEMVCRSREQVLLVSGRRGREGDPLTPSRLLLACEESRLAERVLRFYGEDEESSRMPPRLLMAPGGRSRFAVPRPEPPAKPLARLSVTAFRSYLACPYRFYLAYVRGLEAAQDGAVEMDGLMFGNLAHEVLYRFGREGPVEETDAERLAGYLSEVLAGTAREWFGGSPSAAVQIQCMQLEHRLGAFARWQVSQVQAGWRIERRFLERRMDAKLDVDGEPFTVSGRIDRIDLHPDAGYRILDYKTSDTAVSPEKAHRVGQRDAKAWVDLQLPLYTVLGAAMGIGGEVALGYVQLPKQREQVGLALAEWSGDEIAEAVEQARWVVRQIRAGNFWPPAEETKFETVFDAICAMEAGEG